LRWIYRNDNQIINVAVLEIKNTKVLRFDDFLPGLTNQENARALRDMAQGEYSGTHFKENGYWISKQAKKYSQNVCPDVAVFD
jgi:hypothetical protein